MIKFDDIFKQFAKDPEFRKNFIEEERQQGLLGLFKENVAVQEEINSKSEDTDSNNVN